MPFSDAKAHREGRCPAWLWLATTWPAAASCSAVTPACAFRWKADASTDLAGEDLPSSGACGAQQQGRCSFRAATAQWRSVPCVQVSWRHKLDCRQSGQDTVSSQDTFHAPSCCCRGAHLCGCQKLLLRRAAASHGRSRRRLHCCTLLRGGHWLMLVFWMRLPMRWGGGVGFAARPAVGSCHGCRLACHGCRRRCRSSRCRRWLLDRRVDALPAKPPGRQWLLRRGRRRVLIAGLLLQLLAPEGKRARLLLRGRPSCRWVLPPRGCLQPRMLRLAPCPLLLLLLRR